MNLSILLRNNIPPTTLFVKSKQVFIKLKVLKY